MSKLSAAPQFLVLVGMAAGLATAQGCQDADVTARAKAQEVWQEHERVVEAAANGQSIDFGDFWEASLFFEKLTGITVPGEHSTLIDYAPTEDTAKALEPLRRWYRENGDRLLWDEEKQAVTLEPQ